MSVCETKCSCFKIFGNTFVSFAEPIKEINGEPITLDNFNFIRKNPSLRKYFNQNLTLLGIKKTGKIISVAFSAKNGEGNKPEMAVNIIHIRNYQQLINQIKDYLS